MPFTKECFSNDISYHRINSSIHKIRNCSFFRRSLTQITIPSSETSIGESAFYGCPSLTQITIPSSVTQISGGVFNECIKLREIVIESGNETKFEYFERKFFICKSNSESEVFDTLLSFTPKDESTIVPPFIKIIAKSAYSRCSSLTQITIPSSVTSIEESTFYDCSSLTQIAIPSSVTKIGDDDFNGCSSLAQITIPSSVTSIGNFAFAKCSSLKQITIPSSVAKIGEDIFILCSSLKKITIPFYLIRSKPSCYCGFHLTVIIDISAIYKNFLTFLICILK